MRIGVSMARVLSCMLAATLSFGATGSRALAATGNGETIDRQAEPTEIEAAWRMLPAMRELAQRKHLSLPSIRDGGTEDFGPDPVIAAIAAYHADRLAEGDRIAASIENPLTRTALEWIALRDVPQGIGLDRLKAFVTDHPDWPAMTWLRHQIEARLFYVRDPIEIERFFTSRPPETVQGKLALAKALKATGRAADATRLARAVFRESDLAPPFQDWLKTEFGSELTRGDYKYRADRLLYQSHVAAALLSAAKAGPDVVALTRARVAIGTSAPSARTIEAVPVAWRQDPGLILAEAQRLRHAGKLIEAARLLQSASRDSALLIEGDTWWIERRALARDLLDAGKVNAAYITCALHAAASRESDIDAEFHAGWIALRFMHDPERASYHFEVAAHRAETPTSIARIAYWQGRTADAAGDPTVRRSATAFYRKAAAYGSTYYGQLARAALNMTDEIVREPGDAITGDDRAESLRVIEMLYSFPEKAAGSALATSAAETLTDPRQISALVALIARQQDAHLALAIGKILQQRGLQGDALAFPTFGIPLYKELPNSASQSMVYSVARQESAFTAHAESKAGAKGLMQIVVATAKQTARRAGLTFSAARLLRDAAFNAQLGAAHLGALLTQHRGSLILTFAAYNAGEGRVRDWVAAYGDPRAPGVDPVDWVERIPFAETRNYVQRVMANVAVYSEIFAGKSRAVGLARTARDTDLPADLDAR